MAPDRADLQAAIAEALDESKFPTEERVAAQEWEDWDDSNEVSAPAADDEAAPSKAETAETVEEPAEAEEAQPPVPDEFWGVSLEGIPAEQARAILDKLQQQETYIGSLQARLAEKPAVPEAAPAPTEEAGEVTDEALAIALGYDPEDPYNQPTAAELKLARTVLDLEDKLEVVTRAETTRQVETAWNSGLDELEAQYGTLPVSRLDVLRFAVEENIASPFEAYFRLKAPAQREVENAVAEARRKAAKQAEAGGVKPRSAAATTPVIDPKTTSLRDAVAISMKEAEKETGLSWKQLFGRKVPIED